MNSKLFTLPCLLAVLILLVSCAGDGQPEAASNYDPDRTGPLGDALHTIWGYEDAAREQERLLSSQEEAIAACMAAEGFEYVPIDYSAAQLNYGPGSAADPAEPDWGTVAYAEKYGYQISYWQYHPESAPTALESEWVNPNDQITAEMSPGELRAYYEALYGINGNGCADQEVDPSGMVNRQSELDQDPDYQALQQELNTFWEQNAADPRRTELEDAWTACMRSAGFTYASQREPQAELAVAWEEFLAEQGLAGTDASFLDIPPAALDEFREREYRTAIADARCIEETGFFAKRQELQLAREAEFYHDHQDLIDTLVERYRN